MLRPLLLAFSFLGPLLAQESSLREAARLDSEQKCAEAERLYLNALAQGTPSTALLNNAGNHYVVCGDPAKAQSYFLRILKSNSQHPNANVQLARIAADRHQGAQALAYLSRVTGSQPETRMVRAEALHWAGRRAEATALLDTLAKETGNDPRLTFLFGLTCARIGAYERAEAAFTEVVAAAPNDFDAIRNLARAAARGGHYSRAQKALDVALRLRPDDVDSLVELGEISVPLQDYARAIYSLARARQLAPQRAEIALALARAAQAGEYYGDAAIAYEQYLSLKPGDDTARRDHALVCSLIEARNAEGLKELAAYLQKHPEDPVGHYNLALVVWRDRPEEALDALSKAIRLDARFTAAYVNRAWLLNRLGRGAEAVPGLQKAIEIDPRDFRALDQLAIIYSSLDRPTDAERMLRQALSVKPEEPDILLHLGRTLIELGREPEAQQYLKKFEALRPQGTRAPWQQAGMIESATESAGGRTTRQIQRLRQDAAAHPDDPELQFHLAALLMTDGQLPAARAEFRVLLERNQEARVWAEAGNFLLGFREYGLAEEFLQRAADQRPEAFLDLAIALYFSQGPAQALSALERVPEAQQSGDYFLLKASILDASGQSSEAEKILDRGMTLSISRPQIAQQAVLLLLRHHHEQLALDLLNRAAASDPELRVTKAILLGLTDRAQESEKALREIEAQWPEWDRPYVAHGLLLEHREPREAARKLRIALALRSEEPAARCTLGRIEGSTSSDPRCACGSGLRGLLLPMCSPP